MAAQTDMLTILTEVLCTSVDIIPFPYLDLPDVVLYEEYTTFNNH